MPFFTGPRHNPQTLNTSSVAVLSGEEQMKVVVIDGVKYAPVEEKVEQKILGTGRYALTDLAKALLILHEEYPWWKVDVSLNEEDEEIIIKTRGWFIWISLGGETEG